MTPPHHINGWPQALNEFIDKFPDRSLQQVRRARMCAFGVNVAKAWHEIEKANKDNESLANVFLLLPDEVTAQPFTAIYGKRVLNPDEESKRYKNAIKAIDLLLPLISANGYGELSQDMDGGDDKEAWLAAQQLNRIQLNVNLRNLRKILEVADPYQKRLSKYHNEDQAARATYTKLVAELNRHLRTPKYSALTTLANANCPGCVITADAIKKAWKAITNGEVKL